MAPLFHTLKNDFDIKICVTGQHRQMLDQVLSIFEINPEYDLDIMKPNQTLSSITTQIIKDIESVLKDFIPDLVLVHGDTTTAMATALSAFYLGIHVGHIEAGLRTNNILSPFPEELNRQIISRIARFHFAPTAISKQNLIDENIPEKRIIVTGNTVIDAMFAVLEKARSSPMLNTSLLELDKKNKIILVTGHRRENFGKGFEAICSALAEIAVSNPETNIIYPVHLNPNVLGPVKSILEGYKNVYLIEPLNYLEFLKLLDLSYLVLTDSGGIQEEAPSLGKPVLVMRDSTERPEAIDAGTVKLVGTNKSFIVSTVNNLLNDKEKYLKMSKALNPFGDGTASSKIKQFLLKKL